MSFTSTVPAAVPSVGNSSVPFAAVVARYQRVAGQTREA